MALDVATANVAARHFDTLANRATGATNADGQGPLAPSAHRETDAGAAEPSRAGVGPGALCHDCDELGVDPGCYCQKEGTR